MPLEQTDIPFSVSVGEYFSHAFLPELKCPSSTDLFIVHVNKAAPWPTYSELQRERGTRTIIHVQRAQTLGFVQQVQHYKRDYLAQTYLRIGTKMDKAAEENLVLPSEGYVKYEEKDVKVLSTVHNEQLFMRVMEHYIFGTISDGLRMTREQSVLRKLPEMASLKFTNCSHLCNVRHPRWEIMALEGTPECPTPFFIFCTTNHVLGTEDFSNFISPRRFGEGELDKPSTIANTLWAAIHDTCKQGGRFFAVTNYTRWAFGEISRDGKTAAVTQAFEAPILRFNGTYNPTQAIGCNVIEMVLFWAHWSLLKS